MYAANRSMDDCCFCNADGDLLIVPQQGVCGHARCIPVHPVHGCKEAHSTPI